MAKTQQLLIWTSVVIFALFFSHDRFNNDKVTLYSHDVPPEISVAEPPTTTIGIIEAVEVEDLVPATRITLQPIESTTTTTIPVGIFDLPFAPEGLSDCDEFDYYRTQFGLPERFNALAWRESNCRNEDDVKTWCCHGYLQLYISLQIRDYRITDRYHLCGVWSSDDVNSDTPLDKQRQVCAAAVLYDVVGYSAWAL